MSSSGEFGQEVDRLGQIGERMAAEAAARNLALAEYAALSEPLAQDCQAALSAQQEALVGVNALRRASGLTQNSVEELLDVSSRIWTPRQISFLHGKKQLRQIFSEGVVVGDSGEQADTTLITGITLRTYVKGNDRLGVKLRSPVSGAEVIKVYNLYLNEESCVIPDLTQRRMPLKFTDRARVEEAIRKELSDAKTYAGDMRYAAGENIGALKAVAGIMLRVCEQGGIDPEKAINGAVYRKVVQQYSPQQEAAEKA